MDLNVLCPNGSLPPGNAASQADEAASRRQE
jgi:hypothetical protein